MRYIKFYEDFGVDEVALVLAHMMEDIGAEDNYALSDYFPASEDLKVYVFDSEYGEKTPDIEGHLDTLRDVDPRLNMVQIFDDGMWRDVFDEDEGAFVVWRGKAEEAADAWLWESYSDIQKSEEGYQDSLYAYYGLPGRPSLFYTEDEICYFSGEVWSLFEAMGVDDSVIRSIVDGFVAKHGVPTGYSIEAWIS